MHAILAVSVFLARSPMFNLTLLLSDSRSREKEEKNTWAFLSMLASERENLWVWKDKGSHNTQDKPWIVIRGILWCCPAFSLLEKPFHNPKTYILSFTALLSGKSAVFLLTVIIIIGMTIILNDGKWWTTTTIQCHASPLSQGNVKLAGVLEGK